MGPLASPKTGKVERVYPFPPLSPHPYPTPLARDDFDSLILNPAFLTIRNAKRDFYQLGIRPSHLRLLMGKGQLFRDECVSFLAKRQPDWHFHAEVSFEIREFSVGDEFGITAFYQYNDHIRLAYQREKLHQQLVLIVRKHGIDRVVFRQILDATKIQLRLVGANQSYRFSYRIVDEWIPCGRGVNGRHLNSDSADGHTGVLIGMYASSLFGKNDHFVDIDSFELSDIQVKKSQKQKEN